MIAKSASSYRPASGPVVAVLAAALFLASWALLHEGFYEREQIVDTPVYERYGDAMLDGRVPYRDFALEYPPGALPVFLVPALGDGPYAARFEGLMAAIGVGVVLVVAASGASAALPFVALAPLLLGSVVLSRFDLWPALLAVAALVLLLRGSSRFGSILLGAAAAAKLYPAVLAPLVLAHVWRTRGRREALVSGALAAGTFFAILLPFAVLAPRGLWESFWTQASRPLQVESLGSGLLLAAHHLLGLDVTVESSHGSQNLAGAAADAIAAATTAAQIVAVALVWGWYLRGPAEANRAVRAAAASVAAFIAFGKVFSPQFLIWLIPLVPLVRGRRGLAASAVLALALVLTQLWFPYRYWELAVELDGGVSALVLARDLAVVALVAVLTLPGRGGRARSA